MKKILLITLLIIPILGFSQAPAKPIDSFLGIKFGSSTAEVETALAAKGARFDKTHSKPERYLFYEVKVGHRTASVLSVYFVDNKAYEADFYFKAEPEPQVLDIYNNFVNDISDVYGKGKATKSFKEPYSDGDGYEVTAIKGGSAIYKTFWGSEKANRIIMGIQKLSDDNLYISLIYVDSVLNDIADKKDKAKEKSDL